MMPRISRGRNYPGWTIVWKEKKGEIGKDGLEKDSKRD